MELIQQLLQGMYNNKYKLCLFIIIYISCDLKLNNFLRPSTLKEALRQMEKVLGGDQTCNKRAQILIQYESNRYHKLTVDEQVDCIIDQATDIDILGRSWAGLETFM